MRCREFRRLYSAYRDGSDPTISAAMEDHIESCASCAAYDRALRHGVEVLRGARLNPSPDFMERLNARLASGETVAEPVPPRVSPLAATAAAILFLALVFFTVRQTTVVTPVAAAEQPELLAQPKMIAGIPFVAFQRAP